VKRPKATNFSSLLTIASLIAIGTIAARSRQTTALAAEHSLNAPAHTIITFDAPGAGTGKGQGTAATVVTDDRSIAGWYLDSQSVKHGFFRAHGGAFATFDPPASTWTSPQGMSAKLAIVGYYSDSNNVSHGFLRAPQGKINTFDFPDAGTASGQGTFAGSININGGIVGYYIDSNNVFHGFLRTPDGKFTGFDAPDAGTGFLQGTQPASTEGLTDLGAIAGTFYDSNNNARGFVRDPRGTFTNIDIASSFGTYVAGINAKNTVTGQYVSSDFFGFVRTPTGKITSFDVEAGTPEFSVATINTAGAVAGWYVDSDSTWQAYVRESNGQITKFSVESAGTGSGKGTLPHANNSTGAITGYYADPNGVIHGFLRE